MRREANAALREHTVRNDVSVVINGLRVYCAFISRALQSTLDVSHYSDGTNGVSYTARGAERQE